MSDSKWIVGLLLGGLACVAPVFAADEEPEKDEQTSKFEEIDDARAREILREVDRNLRSKEARLKVEATEALLKHSNEQFVSPLSKLLKDRDTTVVVAACKALGQQPYSKAQSALLKLMRNPKYSQKTEIAEAAILGLGNIGWGKSGFPILRELFDNSPKEIKKALFIAFGLQKEKAAFSLFVDHFDYPAPENVNSASNPPASYWRQRAQEWNFFKRHVKEGMEAITGETFTNKKQAIEWAKKGPGRKLKFVYKRGH